MERRNLLAAILLLLIMPLMRFVELWQRPELEEALDGWRIYEADEIDIFFAEVRLFVGSRIALKIA